jgi:hypothetical protein
MGATKKFGLFVIIVVTIYLICNDGINRIRIPKEATSGGLKYVVFNPSIDRFENLNRFIPFYMKNKKNFYKDSISFIRFYKETLQLNRFYWRWYRNILDFNNSFENFNYDYGSEFSINIPLGLNNSNNKYFFELFESSKNLKPRQYLSYYPDGIGELKNHWVIQEWNPERQKYKIVKTGIIDLFKNIDKSNYENIIWD